MKKDMEIMKKNKITKIMLYSVLSCVIATIIFLTIGYFGKEKPVQKKDSSQSEKKQEQVEQMKDNEHDENNTQATKQQEQDFEKKDYKTNNKVIQNKEKNIVRDRGNESEKTNSDQDYKEKKLSELEGVGSTGKVFNSQKEALDFGKQVVKKLTEEDKKPRQFSISKVTAKDGNLVGWTVDIFENNSVEKIVSNPTDSTEKDKEKE